MSFLSEFFLLKCWKLGVRTPCGLFGGRLISGQLKSPKLYGAAVVSLYASVIDGTSPARPSLFLPYLSLVCQFTGGERANQQQYPRKVNLMGGERILLIMHSGLLGARPSLAKTFLALTLILILYHWFSSSTPQEGHPYLLPFQHNENYHVGIIGSRLAGISCALALAKLAPTLASPNVKIHIQVSVFEAKSLAGGRLALETKPSEFGPSSVYPYGDPFQDPITADDIAGNSLLWNNDVPRSTAENSSNGSSTSPIYLCKKLDNSAYNIHNGVLNGKTTRPISKTSWGKWLSDLFRYGFSIVTFKNLVGDSTQRLEKLSTGVLLNQSVQEWVSQTGNLDKAMQDAIDPQVRRATGMTSQRINGVRLAIALVRENQVETYEGTSAIDVLGDLLGASPASACFGCRVTGIHLSSRVKENWRIDYERRGTQFLRGFTYFVLAAPGLESLLRPTSIIEADDNVTTEQSPMYHPAYVTFFATPYLLHPATFGSRDPLPPDLVHRL
ncbi:hypothetical protein BDZ45DRAFT_745518 [Acephala macrosclerotiorum]|nr:hypothetical protein BDZ45DRAFT_745518 [Acephala macrosclerotiorum]